MMARFSFEISNRVCFGGGGGGGGGGSRASTTAACVTAVATAKQTISSAKSKDYANAALTGITAISSTATCIAGINGGGAANPAGYNAMGDYSHN